MKKKKIVLTGVAIMALIGVVLGATYAYFVAQTGAGQSANVNVQAGTTDSLRFEVTNNLNIYASLENFAEGKDNLSKNTDLKAILKPNNNTNEARYNYYIYLDIGKNELEYTTEDNKPELLLKVTKPNGTELTTIEGLEYKSVVNNKDEEVSGFDITTKKELITIANGYEIYANGSEITQNWNVEIILVNLGSDQNKNTNKRVDAEAKIQNKGKFFLKGGPWVDERGPHGTPWSNGSIKALVFEPSKNIHKDAINTYDMSRDQDGSIIGYEVQNEDDSNTTLYINSVGDIMAYDVENWFSFMGFLNSIEGLEYFDISQVTNMRSMFSNASSLTTLDLSNFDTSNVTSMSFMFDGTSSLTTLDLSSFNTSNVIDMRYMFRNCSSLTLLDVSGFDTSNVTDMRYMFRNCSSLTLLDVSGFDTSNVTDMNGMFDGASSLTELDLSSFDTSNVTSMGYMFSEASSLTSLDLSGFDTSKVISMYSMFSNCNSLTELDISNMTFDSIDLSNKRTYIDMFSRVPNNIHIKVKDEAAREFIQARLDEANITEGVIEVVNK